MVLVFSLIAIAIAGGLVVFALHKRGEPAHEKTATAAATPTRTSAAANPAPPDVSTRPSPTPPSPAPTTGASTTNASAPSPGSTANGDAAASPALDVLNDSRIKGLAARATKEFRSAGWVVSTIGNFQGDTDVPATTIFYPDGEEPAAARLAAAFGVARVLQAPASLSSQHLTVVLARDWPDTTG